MHKALIMEIAGQWVVVVETGAGHQEYQCDTLAQAQHWAALLGAPIRQTHSGVRARPEA